MRWTWALVLALAAGTTAAPAQQTAAERGTLPPPTATERFLTLDVTVNGVMAGAWPLVERAGVLHAPREALDDWRLRPASGIEPVQVRGNPYWPLTAIPGYTSKVNFSAQSIELTFAPEAFIATRLSRELGERPRPSPVLPSTFLNYDISYSSTRTDGETSGSLGAVLELGWSGPKGVLTSSHVARGLAAHGPFEQHAEFVRLETTFTRDEVDANRTLRLGDAVTRTGMWGQPVYFGGIQWGTNFSLSPGLITQPLPIFRGISAAPSTVELYVNNALRQVNNVPSGPFTLDSTAGLTGSGEARLVVRDLLGREVVLLQPFFTSSYLLRPGLNDWSIEAGALRRDLGLSSAGYGTGFLSGTWRRGATSDLTVEVRGEGTRDTLTLGAGAVTPLLSTLLLRAALAASRDIAVGDGARWLLGLERQWLRNSFQVEVQGSTRDFRLLSATGLAATKLQLGASVNLALSDTATLGLGAASIQRYGQERVDTVSATLGLALPAQARLSASISRIMGPSAGTAVSVFFNLPLTNDMRAGVTSSRQSGRTDTYATATRQPITGLGLGWRVLAGHSQGESRAEGGLQYSSSYGRVSGEVSAGSQQTSVRLGATGGLVWTASRLFVAPRVDQSFAIARVSDMPGLSVGLGSNLVARTDGQGLALVPNLAPYQSNSLRLDARELPLNAEVQSLEQVVVPSWRSAVLADFPVRAGRAALLRIRFDDNQPAPAGATIHIEGDAEEFSVARRGEAYVTGLTAKSQLTLRWQGQSCPLTIALPPATADEVLRLGPLACKGVNR